MQVVAYFTKDVKPILAEPQLKFNGDLTKPGLMFLLQQVQLTESSGICGAQKELAPQIEGCLVSPQTNIQGICKAWLTMINDYSVVLMK